MGKRAGGKAFSRKKNYVPNTARMGEIDHMLAIARDPPFYGEHNRADSPCLRAFPRIPGNRRYK
jgi:hypothetical protein